MRILKKWLFVGFTISVLVLSFSLSASAVEFSPLPNPSYSGKESDDVYYFNTPSLNPNYSYSVGFLYGSSYDTLEYYYVDFNLSSSYNISDFVFSPAIVKNGSHFWLGVAATCNSYSGTSWSNLFSGYPNRVGYSQNGTLISSSSMRYFAFYSGRYIFADLVDLGTTIPDSFVFTPVNGVNGVYLSSSLPSGFTVYTVNSSHSSAVTYSMPVLPVEVLYYFNDGFTNADGPTGNIYSLVASGILEPVYDNDGNIVNYNINYEVDYSQFFAGSDAPDPYDSSGIDDYNSEQAATDEAIDSFRGDYEFSDVFDDFDITEFNDGMSFWEEKFDDIVSSNSIFIVVIVSMLTLGIIVVILNRRVGVG